MKKKLTSISMIFLALLGSISACDNYIEGVDEFDPTLPRDASLGQVINAAEVGVMAFAEGDLARTAGIFSRQFTGADRQYTSLNNYNTTAVDYNSQWGNIYGNALKSLRIARSKADAVNNLRAKALTQILEAYVMGMAAAGFGDIPFSQAANLAAYPNPAYDSQLDVYNGVIAMLDAAIANIESAAASVDYDGDIFGGEDAEWIARANTLKAKFHLHLKQFSQAAAAAQLGINDSDDDILAPHGGSYLQDFNIYYSFLQYDRVGYMTADFAMAPHLLDPAHIGYRGNTKTNEGARFSWYYAKKAVAVPVAEYDINSQYSEDFNTLPANDGFFSAVSSFPILTYAENQLILAEALLRTGDAPGALAALNAWRADLNTGYRIAPGHLAKGIAYAPYTPADFAPGGIENVDGITDADALYREIIEEKYISLIGSLETFNDVRRRGFGSFAGMQNWQVLGIVPNTGSQIPQRFLIPQSELNSNTSVPASPPGLFDKTAVFQ